MPEQHQPDEFRRALKHGNAGTHYLPLFKGMLPTWIPDSCPTCGAYVQSMVPVEGGRGGGELANCTLLPCWHNVAYRRTIGVRLQ